MAAIFGGYVLAAALSSSLALLLPMSPQNSVIAASMLGYLGYAGAILWAFAAPSAWRAWLWILVPAVLGGLVVWFNWKAK
ncbi:MAG: hypothetical protein QM680_10250 [Luteolibacter sp.]